MLPDSTTPDTELPVDSTTVDSTVDSTAVDSAASVDSTSVDSANADASVSDSAADSIADTAVTDSSFTDADAPDPCAVVAGNLVTDGDFSTGVGAWTPQSCSREIITGGGRCGRNAIRIYDAKGGGRALHSYDLPSELPAGTKLHVRGWFKKGTGAWSGTPPGLFIRFWGVLDGGTYTPDEFTAAGAVTDTWVMTDRVFTLSLKQTSFTVYLASYFSDADAAATDEFEVSDVSLVVE